MRAFCRALERAIEALAAAMVATFAVVILADVVCRYWLHIPIPWVSEFTVLLFQVTAFLGSTLALRRGLHFGLGMITRRVWPELARPIGIVVATVISLTSLFLLVLAVRMARQTWDATYATLEISHGWAYAGLAVSAGLMTLFGIESAFEPPRSESPEAA